jgi:hypothetical protein
MFGSSLPPHIVLCFYFASLRRLYYMLPVSLDGPCLIAPSGFANIYIQQYLLPSHAVIWKE